LGRPGKSHLQHAYVLAQLLHSLQQAGLKNSGWWQLLAATAANANPARLFRFRWQVWLGELGVPAERADDLRHFSKIPDITRPLPVALGRCNVTIFPTQGVDISEVF
jgi:hypothetical protein